MRNRTKVLTVIAVCLLIVACVVIAVRMNEQKKREEQQRETLRREEEYGETLQAVSVLNEKSYFYGYQLLGDAPENYYTHGKNYFVEDGEDTYHCFPYRGREGIAQIFLYSGESNLFGIHIGDSRQNVFAVMEDEGFALNKEEDGSCLFDKLHISVYFEFTAEDTVEVIGINVIDPYAESVVY